MISRRQIRDLDRLPTKARFKVHVRRSGRGQYYVVIVVDRRRHVRKAWRIIRGRGAGRCVGFCHTFDTKCVGSRSCIGFVVLAFSEIGSGYVSHELTHAAHFYLAFDPNYRKMRVDDDRTYEPLADLQGWLVAQFWTRFYHRFPGLPIYLKEPA